MSNLISILTLVITVFLAVGAIVISWIFYKRTSDLQVDISGFIIQEVNKNPNYVYPYRGKDGKLHKAVLASPIKGKITFAGTLATDKNKEKKD
jgi:hypothetical protein